MDTDAHPIYNELHERINADKPIKTGNHVWIGCRSILLKGTQIAYGCVIGTSSFLNKKFESQNSIIAGNLAINLKDCVKW